MNPDDNPRPEINYTGELSARETELIAALCAGATELKELARKLGIKRQTVKNHLTVIYYKTGAYNLASLLLWGMRNGYMEG